jgi:glycosyltransferase involved in cell wall biosynthesis
VSVLDTAAPGLRRFVRHARAAARTGAVCVGVYPTTMTVYRPGLLPRAVILRALFGRARLRFHLHEFQHLRRMLRWPAKVALLLPGRVVVSSAPERDAVRGAFHGLIGRRCEVEVAAPTNGTAPTAEELDVSTAAHPDQGRTVGVFGLYRPDKGIDWVDAVLERLDPRFDRLVVAGGGWHEHEWALGVRGRYDIELLGHVRRSGLARTFAACGLAVAPLWKPAHDGRMSVRTPLAFGVPTLTVGPRGADLTLAPHHLLLLPPTDPTTIDLDALDRRRGAQEVAAFEHQAALRLADVLFG